LKKKKADKEEHFKVPPPLDRGLSISDFYTVHAGLHDEIEASQMDEFHNPEGREYDLGHESAFGMFSVILFNFNDQDGGKDPRTLFHEAITALQTKGFRVTESKSEKEFLDDLHNHDQAWFTSANRNNFEDQKRFLEEMRKFHESGKGIAVWADNDPYYANANIFLEDIFGFKLKGNTPGEKVLELYDGPNNKLKNGNFSRHLLTTGIVKLYEGITICFPEKLPDYFEVIGQSSDGHPCMFVAEPEKRGRILVDCGFTKLYKNWWGKTAGTERYVRNIGVWLLALDYRIKIGAQLQGSIHQ